MVPKATITRNNSVNEKKLLKAKNDQEKLIRNKRAYEAFYNDQPRR